MAPGQVIAVIVRVRNVQRLRRPESMPKAVASVVSLPRGTV